MSAGTAKPTTCPRCLGPLAYGHAGATRIFLGSCCDKGPRRLRAAGHEPDLRHRMELGAVSGAVVPFARRAPVADAVEEHDRAERAPARPRRSAEAFEERARLRDRPPRARP